MKTNQVKKPSPKTAHKFKQGQRLTVTIKRLGINGEGIAYHNRKIIFIEKALPGEEVLVEITKELPKYAQAKLLKIIKKSPDRVTPRDRYDVGGLS